MKRKKVIIIGGGLSGLSLATELADENFSVTILEKENYLGGRASNTWESKMNDPVPIGPHIFLSSYNNFFRFLEKIKSPKQIYFDEKVLVEYIYNKRHFQFKINKNLGKFYSMPWVFKNSLLSWKDKLSITKLILYLYLSSEKKLNDLDETNAYEFLKRQGISNNAIDKFYRFITISLLNVPIQLCSAGEFALLLKKWIEYSPLSFGFSTVGLGDLYTHKAKEYLLKKKCKILVNTTVKKIIVEKNKVKHLIIEEHGAEKKLTSDIYISTVNPIDLRPLLPHDIRFNNFFKHINAFEGVSYISVNLWFDKKVTNKQFWALLPTEDTPAFLNTDFYDQSNIYQTKKKTSYITSNIIYSKAYSDMTDSEIVAKTLGELKEAFPKMKAKLIHSKVNRIPYVIYAPYPGIKKHKLSHKTPVSNLYLAGDWTQNLVQCMETAVVSGYKCAEEILRDYKVNKVIHTK